MLGQDQKDELRWPSPSDIFRGYKRHPRGPRAADRDRKTSVKKAHAAYRDDYTPPYTKPRKAPTTRGNPVTVSFHIGELRSGRH